MPPAILRYCSVSAVVSAEVGRDMILARVNGDESCFLVTGKEAGRGSKRLSPPNIEVHSQAPLVAGTRQPPRSRISMGAANMQATDDRRTNSSATAISHWTVPVRERTARSCCSIALCARTPEARLKLEAELMRAAEQNEFELYYQPQVRLLDGEVVGAEALIRWRHPDRGLVSPGDFIPVINNSPISDKVAGWILADRVHPGPHLGANGSPYSRGRQSCAFAASFGTSGR